MSEFEYSSLVTSARALADVFDLTDRISFLAGALGSVTIPVGDAYYFFEPSGISVGIDPTRRSGSRWLS
jgi:hypothetical protein